MSLDSRLLDVLSQVVIARDRRCLNCRRTDGLTCHHVLPRQFRWGRYNPENCLTLCDYCHGGQKVNPEVFERIVVGITGQEKYQELMSHKNELMFYTRLDYDVQLTNLRKLLIYYNSAEWRRHH